MKKSGTNVSRETIRGVVNATSLNNEVFGDVMCELGEAMDVVVDDMYYDMYVRRSPRTYALYTYRREVAEFVSDYLKVRRLRAIWGYNEEPLVREYVLECVCDMDKEVRQ